MPKRPRAHTEKPAREPASVDDRVLPHSLDAERAVLGSIFVGEGAIDRARGVVRGSDFFRWAHRHIFEAMLRVADERKEPIDLLTVMAELTRRKELDECGGPAYISSLTDGIPRSANVATHAALVREHAARRAVIKAATEMLTDAYDAEQSARDVVQAADKAIVELYRGEPGRLVDVRESSGALYSTIEYRVAHQGQLRGVDTGFRSINDLTFGWQAADMNVIAARPSIGKTAFMLNTAIAGARTGKHIAIFSLEMKREQLHDRMLATLSGVDLYRINGGFLSDDELGKLSEAMTELQRMPLFIDDRAGQKIQDIRAGCRRQRAEGGLDLVMIDYVQLIDGSTGRRGATRNEEVADISRRTKLLADELNVPILLLSQLNRGADSRQDKRPIMSDLRESGSLEQDADVIMFLHRKHHLQSGTTAAIFEKQRNGPGGTLLLTFTRETQTIIDGGQPEPEEPAKPARAKQRGLRY